MHILITNDDGVHAAGIYALAHALQDQHEVTIVAPDRERSACSHSLTLDRPLCVRRVSREGLDRARIFSVNGTPVDCVRIGLGTLLSTHVDLLLSGINAGANLGGDISYSGTVHAALEGAVCGTPAIAFSLRVKPQEQPEITRENYSAAAFMATQIVDKIQLPDPSNTVLNVNFPENATHCPQEVKVCPQGISVYDTTYYKQNDPFGREYYWIYAQENPTDYNDQHKTDVYWSNAGWVTATPLKWNATDVASLPNVHDQFQTFRFAI